jgi:DNA primase
MNSWVDLGAVKQAVSMEAVLHHYRVLGLRRHRDQLQGPCPIHGGQRQDSFRASMSKNVFQCFGCKAKGNVLDFVAAMEKCSVLDAARRLQQWFGVRKPSPVRLFDGRPDEIEKRQLVREKEGSNLALRFRLTEVDHSHPYLQQRGIDFATAAEFGVGWYSGPGLMHGRIVIPIRNRVGQVVAYAGRATGHELPKYKLPAGFRKNLEIFNLDYAARTGSQSIIVVEGYFDCMRVHQAGLPCVALMGSSLSMPQELALLEHFQQVILMLDGDCAGRNASAEIAARLRSKCLLRTVQLPEGVQPDQLSRPEFEELLPDFQSHRYTG